MADYTFGVGEELQFTSQDRDLIHVWDFGDGTISTIPNPSHIYNARYIYTVTHIAKDFCDTCINIGSHTVEIAEASITVKSLLLDKYSINVGDSVAVTIIVQNTSLVYGTGTITLKFAGQVVDTRNISLDPLQETSYMIVHQVTRSGTIDVCADNVCTILFVESMISVVSITPNPAISTGNAINATVIVKNNGTFSEEKQIQTTITNQVTAVVDSRLITLIGGETQTYVVPIDVRGLFLPNGTYTLCTDGKCKAISVAIPAGVGNLNIVTIPQGAEVFIDNEDKGVQTNTIITDVAIGDRSFKLTLNSYNDATGIVTINSGMTSYIYISLSPLEETTGSVAITSVPTNANIYIDGSLQLDNDGYQLKTPVTISGLSPTTHDVTLKLSDYLDYDVQVDIVAGTIRYINAILLQAPILIGDISITTNPAGAEIWIDDSNTGKVTPDTIKDASIGLHSFTLIKDGYNNVLGQIDVAGGITSYIYVVMVPIAPTIGGISITSTPPGADIYIDGNVQPATTPATIPNLTPGIHGITLKLSVNNLLYEDFTRSVNIIAGITTYLDIILTPIPITIGSIDFTSYPIGAQIWLDNSNTGRTTPYTLTNISIGSHTFILKLYGYNNTTGSITVIGGAISYVYAILSITEAITGSLSISSVPTGADIYIDGVQQLDINNQPIRTPNTISNLTPGTHGITLKLSVNNLLYEDFNISTNIVAGQTSYISVSMTILPPTTGNINFTTVPDNVEIWLDGSNTGKTTPDILTNISIGTHTFILKKSGYDNATGPITVIGGVTSYIYAVMIPVSAITGSLSISSIPQNADIYVNNILQLDNNGQPLKTPATLMNLDPGAYTIKLKKTGYIDFTTPISIDVIAGQTSYLGVTLSTLQVMEAVMPWWFILSLATGTIYGMLQPKKEKIISKLGRIESKT